MKCSLFSYKSSYYYDISNFVLSDDEEFENFLDGRNKKNELNYLLEKSINKIIVDTKKSCDVNSDYEEIEKMEYKKNELFHSDYLDDIDIILKKSKCENMFLKKNKNDGKIAFPPKNIKQRIYSVNEEKKEIKDNKRNHFQNDKIIENFKNILCNDLNKYFKDMLQHVKKNNKIHNHSTSNIDNDICIINDRTNINNCDVLKNKTKNYDEESCNIINSKNDKKINYYNKESIKCLHCKNINSNKKIYGSSEILKIDTIKKKTFINKKNFKTNNCSINPNMNIEHNQNGLSKEKTYKQKKKNVKKSRSNKKFYFSKKNILNKKNKFLLTERNKLGPYEFNNIYDIKTEKHKNGNNNKNVETLNHSNISLYQGIYDNQKLNALKNSKNFAESKNYLNGESNEDFTFNHFQKNANNNILNKFFS